METENIEKEKEKNNNIYKLINDYDDDISNLDNDFTSARLNIINQIQKLQFQIVELEHIYKSEKIKILSKRNKNIKNYLKIKEKIKKEKRDKTVNQIYV